MRHVLLGAAALFVVVAGVGCVTPGLTVSAYEPAELLAPRGGDRLVLVDGEGRRSAKQHVAHMLVDGSRGSFFRAEDRGRSGVKLTLAGATARVEGGEARSARELWVRVDVIGWDADAIVVRDEDDDGSLRELPGLRGRADLQFTVANTAGEILLREHEVRGVFERQIDQRDDNELARESVIVEAAQVAVTTFLNDITPQRRTQFLAFDDGDSGQRHILRNTHDTLPGLEKRLRRYLTKNTSNAIAHHNLAIVLDAQGRFEEALIEHDRALDIVDREGFFDARSDTVRRRTAWERVYGDRPTPDLDASPDAPPAPVAPGVPAPGVPTAPAAPAEALPSSSPSEPIAP
jgi:hypothetical protein